MTKNGIEDLPQPDARDKLHQLVASLISPIPYAEPILTAIVKPPLDKRREAWLMSLSEAIAALQKNYGYMTPDYLANHPAFITAVLNCTSIALRNHQEKKLNALRNVVLNSALPNAPDDDLQQMFIHILDIFSTWHLQLLKFFANQTWFEKLGYPSTLDNLPAEEAIGKLEMIFPELSGRQIFVNKVVHDLSDNRLIALPEIRIDAQQIVVTSEKVSPNVISELGEQFLLFIIAPIDT